NKNLLSRRPVLRRQFEFRKIEPGRDGAADQCPVAGALGRLPGVRRHDSLRHFAGGEIGAERNAASSGIVGDLERQRIAGVIVPDLDRINAVPVRAFATCQQEIDRGGEGAAVGIAARIAKGLAVMAALGMRLQFEPRDDVGGRHHCKLLHQDLFLRSRSSPKISAAPAPFIRTLAATDGSSARRNTFAFFSSPSETGMVGLPSARSFVTCSARAFSAALSGSIVSANLMLEAVYSWPQ